MRIHKYNELFNAGNVSASLQRDLKEITLKRFFGDFKVGKWISIYKNSEESFESSFDAIDFVLDSFRSDDKKSLKVVNGENYILVNIGEISKDYGFSKSYVGIKEEDKIEGKEFEILISDDRYINKIKRIYYNFPFLSIGKIIKK